MKYLIVNADDLGLSPGVNRGVLRAYDDGIVTSASLMVRPPTASQAVESAASRLDLSLGLHLDLGEWSYRDGRWLQIDHVVPLDDPLAIAGEVHRQIHTFRRLTGIDPTHIDSHQHVHREEPVRSIVLGAARDLNIPVRHFTPNIHYCGDFYGRGRHNHTCPDAITPESLIGVLNSLPEGVSELACHPGEADLPAADYNLERAHEVEALCHPDVAVAIEHHRIKLVSFHQVSPLLSTCGPSP